MDPVTHPLRIAFVGSNGEDRDVAAVLLSQYRPSGFSVDRVDPDGELHTSDGRPHDAFLVAFEQLAPPAGAQRLARLVASSRPVIVLTDMDDDERDERLIEAGAWDCLPKASLTPPMLGRALVRAVAAARERRLAGQREKVLRLDGVARFSGQVAHDFNNLLTAMLGYAEMLREGLDAGDPRREDVREIQRAGERATALTRQLLAFGRRHASRPRILEVNAFVRSIEPTLRSLVGPQVRLEIHPGTGLPDILADAAQLEQMLTSLALNAKEAMPSGGRLTIETLRVELGADWAAERLGARPGPHVMIAVCDTGCGMTPEVQAHLFEPFFTTKPKGKGTGLSLAVVDGIVRQAGGHISVTSEPAAGSTFAIYLPAADAAV